MSPFFRSFSSTESIAKKSKSQKIPTITITLTSEKSTSTGSTLTLLAPKGLTKRTLLQCLTDCDWRETVDFFLERHGHFPPNTMRKQFPPVRPDFVRAHTVEVMVGGQEGMVILDFDQLTKRCMGMLEIKTREVEEDLEDEEDGATEKDDGASSIGAKSGVDGEVQVIRKHRSLSLRTFKESYQRRRNSMGL
ncbi:hypothetical protein K491DRAFT_712111 [Lophiostoma macrostomum CBS 122681]|uniref:Uncharacterized protein n=1 Tax=Lophiostoma macrostomum CBS 122681 TaxID=1314788 RepID=A0A6A6TJL4_9PLEO|nr:hypothetical protein K491DRAFT_712111 [Lophiostoma macrostomum CBS 122681]